MVVIHQSFYVIFLCALCTLCGLYFLSFPKSDSSLYNSSQIFSITNNAISFHNDKVDKLLLLKKTPFESHKSVFFILFGIEVDAIALGICESMDSHTDGDCLSDSEKKPPLMAAKTNEGGSEKASRRSASSEKGKNRAVRRKFDRLQGGFFRRRIKGQR